MTTRLQQLVQDLHKEQAREDTPDPQRCRELLEAVVNKLDEKVTTTITTLQEFDPAALLQTLTACRRTFRLLHRQQHSTSSSSSSSTTTTTVWNDLIQLVAQISTTLQTKAATTASKSCSIDPTMKLPALPNVRRSHSAKSMTGSSIQQPSQRVGATEALKSDTVLLPETVQQYHSRLQKHGKELYKNPPVLPPSRVIVYPTVPALAAPRRKKDGHWTFCPHPLYPSSLMADFMPNVSPAEVLQGGAFGGTYFRAIHSAVTNQSYTSANVLATSVHPTWIANVSADWLTSDTYNAKLNKFKVKCGGSLGMWEVSGFCELRDCGTLSWPP
jgi:hypothetical protein